MLELLLVIAGVVQAIGMNLVYSAVSCGVVALWVFGPYHARRLIRRIYG